MIFWSLAALVLVFCGVVGGYFYFKSKRSEKIRESLGLKLFRIRFPKKEKKDEDVRPPINLMEQFFSSLLSFKKPISFEVSILYLGEEIIFYAGVPEKLSESFVRHVQSVWSDAQVDPAPEYNIFNYSGASSGAWIKLKQTYALPVRTYQEIGADTFAPFVGSLAKVSEVGEGGSIQIIIRQAAPSAKKQILSALALLKKGKKTKEVFGDKFSISISDFGKGFNVSAKSEKEEKEKIIDETAVKALELKLSKSLFDVNIRVFASAPTKENADSILDGIIAGFSQFEAPERNEFVAVKPKNISDLVSDFSFRVFSESQKIVLNSEELASVFHFPTPSLDIPKIQHLKFREVPPPPNLPDRGIVVGESVYRGVKKLVRVTKEDRRRHLYVIGQTGTGKSVLLNNLSGQDIQSGEGVCVIDPNGDLFDDVLSRIPKERLKDVVLFDPSDLERPIGLNMLEYDPNFPEHKTFIVNELMMIFDTLYDLKNTGGPMFEQYARNALLLLMDDPSDGYTILEIPKVLADAEFRKKLLAKAKNIIAKDFWEKEAEKAGGEASLANLVPYITSKFNAFIANDYVRPIIAQSRNTINFRSIMDEGKILLVNLSKGRIGDLNASLLGMIIVGKLTVAAFSRTNVPMDQRKDFYLYIDEFQNFTTPSISTILSEARKYRLCLSVAHQFIGQLSDNIRSAVFGNVGSIIAFRVGAEDGEFLVKQFEPTFTQNDLINIDNLNAHAKMIINGEVARPFNIFVPFPPRGDSSRSKVARDFSRLTYGRPREEVEHDIWNRLKGEQTITK